VEAYYSSQTIAIDALFCLAKIGTQNPTFLANSSFQSRTVNGLAVHLLLVQTPVNLKLQKGIVKSVHWVLHTILVARWHLPISE
jgi:hypothetical protein